MTQKLRVNREMAIGILRDWEERDDWGRRVWSQAKLADKYGLGETTIFRVVNQRGPYQKLKLMAEIIQKPEEELDREIREMEARTIATMQAEGLLPGGGKKEIPPPPPMEELDPEG